MSDEPNGAARDDAQAQPVHTPLSYDTDRLARELRARLSRALVPKQLGHYRILRVLGEGGMGTVYEAEQEHPKRTVALKVIRAGLLSPQLLRRFEHESQVLARLQHPGIAQVYEAGTVTDEHGQAVPFFAMEFIRGTTLTKFVAARNLSTKERLELVARICDAVDHAHQKGVIHRDLKPANILVDESGQPKILDFGVARAIDGDVQQTTLHTDIGQLIGTVPYMSPEQVSGDPTALDTRSDVYALGVIAYQVLAGRLPLDLSKRLIHDAIRIIREEEPSRLSSVDRTLRGDVETIVAKAMEKEKTRRYPSAEAMASDIRRYLVDEPITARPASAWYQTSKFARRNKVLVGGIFAVLITLVVGIAVATDLYLRERSASAREREARVAAETQEKHASAASSFLLSLFDGIDPGVAQGADTRLLQRILSDARGRLSTELAGQPEVEAQIHKTLGSSYMQLTLFDDAELELRRARDLWSETFGPDDRRTLDATSALSGLLRRRGELELAEREQRAMLERQEKLFGANDRDTLSTKSSLGDTLMRQGRFKESEALLRETLAQQEKVLPTDDPEVLSTRVALSEALSFQSKDEEAFQLTEQVYLARRAKLGDDHPETIIALGTMASALREVKRYEEAEAADREALERSQRVFGPDNQQTFSLLNNLSITLEAEGESGEAEEMLRECLERRQRVLGPEHAETLNTINNLGEFLRQHGKVAEAEPLILGGLATMRRVLGPNHRETMRARSNAAMLLAGQHRQREAAELFGEIAARDREILSEDDPARSQDLYNWAATLQNAGDNEASEPVLRELIELVEKNQLESERFVPAARNSLAKVLDARGEHAAADELFRAALAERRKRYGNVHKEVAYSLFDYGESLLDRSDLEAADPLLAELVELERELVPEGDGTLASARQLYGRCLARRGHYADAEEQLLAACEAFSQLPKALPSAASSARAGILALYTAWDAAEPGQGIVARAERWQEKFPAEP